MVLVYIQMTRTLILAKRVELSLRLLHQLYSWGEVLWVRRQFWNSSKVSSLLLVTNPISVKVGSAAAGFSVFPPKAMSSCTADGVIKFLIHKDKAGRTELQPSDCSRVLCGYCRFPAGQA